jgi:hypothetical protein
MAVCKQCGTPFQPTEDAPGCPQCASAAPARKRVVRAPGAGEPAARTPAARAPAAREAAARPAAARPKPAAAAPQGKPKAKAKVVRESAVAHQHAEAAVMDATTKYGLLATLGLTIVVGTTVMIVMRKKAADKAKRDAYEAEVASIHSRVKAIDASDPTAAQAVLKLAEDKKALWIDHDLAGDIQTLVSQAKNKLSQAEEQRASTQRFTDIEAELKQPGIAPERMKDMRRQLDEMQGLIAEAGGDFPARFEAARLGADKFYATRLLEDAAAFRAANAGNPRQALARYQPAEDEIKALLDTAYRQKNKELQDYYTPLYKQAIEESDVVAEELYKAEGEKMPWVDCLGSVQAPNWNASSVSGFSHQVQNGVLQIVGPDAAAGKMAVISIGDREQWRHFQLDFEFTIEKGDIDLYMRLGKSPNANTLAYSLHTTKPEGLLTAGKLYSGRLSVIGSKWKLGFNTEDIDTPSPREETAAWTMSRKGALGLVVAPEARVKFTRFQVREIR